MTRTDPAAPERPSTTVRVRFAETDQMGVAHHGSYVAWLEAARVEWMRHRGLSYRAFEEGGLSMAVARLDLRYRAAARFDDEVAIACRLTALKSRHAAFAYELRLPDGREVASAVTEHVPTDRTGRAVRLPAGWRDALASFLQDEAAYPRDRIGARRAAAR